MDLQINILELIQIVISLILGVFTIIQFFYFIKEVKQNSRNIKDETVWKKQNATIEYYQSLEKVLSETPEYILSKTNILVNGNRNINYRMLLKHTKYRKHIFMLMKYYETFSVGIMAGYFDENLAKHLHYVGFINNYHTLEKYISIRRKETKKQICMHFEIVAKKWEKEPPTPLEY